jgi:hypothetical protein
MNKGQKLKSIKQCLIVEKWLIMEYNTDNHCKQKIAKSTIQSECANGKRTNLINNF